jgi:hypothetical protein
MRILVGGPILERAWIVPAHLGHLFASCEKADVDVELLHVGGGHDEATWQAIEDHRAGRVAHHVIVDEGRRGDRRDWSTPGRKERMVELRNTLLRRVRELAPDLFLSLDSDILLHPDTVKNLLQSIGRFGAVGGHCYMGPGRANPSYLRSTGMESSWIRVDQLGAVIAVDAIMAIKLMTPAAYAVDYKHHRWGEDIGWSKAARVAGVRLGWDSRTVNKHIMEPRQLGAEDRRYDW